MDPDIKVFVLRESDLSKSIERHLEFSPSIDKVFQKLIADMDSGQYNLSDWKQSIDKNNFLVITAIFETR